ncbi:MAG: hypothetical protein GY749_36285 [Desulfobacteraceae bacterium]|nr:hypothetical protein [Desulfobacteraceae bacterium]
MSLQKDKKINRLITGWRRGAVYTTAYLTSEGYSRSLLNRYRKSRWIQPLGRGAYILHNDQASWAGALWAIQHQLKMKIYLGGKSALEQKGYSHYLSPRSKQLCLYSQDSKNLPSWMLAHNWGSEIIFAKTVLFANASDKGLTDFEVKDFPIKISSPERAALEMLCHVPGQITFEEAMLIMENLTALRPEMVQALLEQCRFVKVKRLFMYMSDKCDHQWFRNIDSSVIYMGKGNRQIVKNGKLDKKYRITVPDEFQYEDMLELT